MAAQAKTLMERELLSLLKVDNRGWNMALFNDANKMSVCLCASCGFVCCDAVELDCDHKEDEDIFLYCKQCLLHLIAENEDKCIINSHINPQIAASKAIRRQVLKSMVICPYSQQYKMRNIMQQNNNQQIMGENNININDQKEGNQINENKCQWKEGKLTDLINKHILKCSKTNNPTFTLNVKIKNLEQENIKIRNENEDLQSELEHLRKELAAEKNESVNMRLMYEEEKGKLMNDFAAKEKAAINAQKKQANEIEKLKEIIKAKDNEINQEKEEKKENEFGSKSVLNEITIFKGNDHCIVDLKNSIFTTKGTDKDRTYTYGILEIPWSKDTNGGIHEFKLKCLQSALNPISIGGQIYLKTN